MESKTFTCPFNIGVVCDEKKCERCGWNPIVDGNRKAKKREENKDVL